MEKYKVFKKTWQKEFKIAKSIGFDLIEWIVDENLDNPIFNKDFHRELDHLKNENKIQVISIACDFLCTIHFQINLKILINLA